MKRLKLRWNKPTKKIELEKGSILVAEHKGDVNYARYVRFKQLAPQFWEKMDSPLFAVCLDKFESYHDQGKHAQAYGVLKDYHLSLEMSKQEYDAWGLCFALISYEKDEEVEFVPNDVELEEKLSRMTKAGLTPDVIQESVMDFMRASPETFLAHLEVFAAQNMMSAIDL